jgi:lipopolysaccharide biosynthesis glycosyltransferase
MIFENCDVTQAPDWSVTTVLDRHEVLPYFNDGVLAVTPSAGIFRRWRDNAERLAQDARALSIHPDSNQFFFLDQAIFAGTVLGQLSQEQVKILPHAYNFTLVSRESPAQHAHVSSIDEVTILHYHRAFYSLDWTHEIEISEPLAGWFRSRLPLRRQRRRISTLVRDGRRRHARHRSRIERR